MLLLPDCSPDSSDDEYTLQGEPLDLNDVETWDRYSLGLFKHVDVTNAANRELVRGYVRNCMDQANALRRRTLPRDDVAYPPIRTVASRPTKDTLVRVIVSDEGELTTLPNDESFSDGDGRCPWGGARPACGIPCPLLESTFDHSSVPNDLPVMSQAIMDVFADRGMDCPVKAVAPVVASSSCTVL